MLNIEHCDSVTIQLPGAGGATILSQAIAAGLREHERSDFTKLRVDDPVQTSATPPALGEIWPGEGGRYAGTMPAIAGRASYHLIVAEETQERIKWGPYDHNVASAVDHHDGQANTRALVTDGKDHPAAMWAHGVRVDELQDFYLPAHNELMLMWICAPQIFSKESWYWSSTQYSPYYAWVQHFGGGDSGIGSKGNELRAVAVRRLGL